MKRPTELIEKPNQERRRKRHGKGRGLFWKIFGSFLLIQLLFSAITFGVTFAMAQRAKANVWRDIAKGTFTYQADQLVSIIDHNKGQIQTSETRNFLKDSQNNGALCSIYDDKGNLLLGSPLPASFHASLQRLRQQTLNSVDSSQDSPRLSRQGVTRISEPQLEMVDDKVMGACLLLSRTARHYVLVMQMPRLDLGIIESDNPNTIIVSEIGDLKAEGSTDQVDHAIKPNDLKDRNSKDRSGHTIKLKIIVSTPLATARPAYAAHSVDLAVIQATDKYVASKSVTNRTLSLLNLGVEDIIRITALFLVAGAVCYGLALYLAAPVEALRAATEKLATGDLTARVGPRLGRRRDELASLGHDFDHMAQRLETLMTSQRRLLTDISHELRSPLARLAVALDLAQQDAGSKSQPSLKRIHIEADRMGELISQLLTWTKLENGLDGMIEERFDLAVVLQEIATDAGFEAQTKNAEVSLDAPPEIWIKGARSLLQRALENPIRNAVRHTRPETSVHIKVSPSYYPNLLTIVVQDQGSGVPPESLIHLCEPFYRVEGARDESGGVGLGLSITQRAIESHGGNVQVSNAQNGGLEVKIQLPFDSLG